MHILKLIIFYHGYIYRISVCFVFPCTVKVSIPNHTCTIRPTVHHEIEYFLSWLYIQDFCMFCISIYNEGINTKLHLHYKTKCTSWNWSFFNHGYIYKISVCFVFPCTVKVPIRNYTSTITPTVHLKIDHFYHGYIYRISVCFVFASTVKVSIRNYTCT